MSAFFTAPAGGFELAHGPGYTITVGLTARRLPEIVGFGKPRHDLGRAAARSVPASRGRTRCG